MDSHDGILAASRDEDLSVSVRADCDGGTSAWRLSGITRDDVTVGTGGHACLQGHGHVIALERSKCIM